MQIEKKEVKLSLIGGNILNQDKNKNSTNHHKNWFSRVVRHKNTEKPAEFYILIVTWGKKLQENHHSQ